eukprot:scaffold625_cov324-Pavlova_lutheri.AAC.56
MPTSSILTKQRLLTYCTIYGMRSNARMCNLDATYVRTSSTTTSSVRLEDCLLHMLYTMKVIETRDVSAINTCLLRNGTIPERFCIDIVSTVNLCSISEMGKRNDHTTQCTLVKH